MIADRAMSQTASSAKELLRRYYPAALALSLLASLTAFFNTLYAPEHPVRRAVYFIDTLPSVRIIEGKA